MEVTFKGFDPDTGAESIVTLETDRDGVRFTEYAEFFTDTEFVCIPRDNIIEISD